jgi:MFS family permease
MTGPSIADDLDLGGSGLVWVGAAYFLSFSGLLLLGGRVADLVGWRRAFVFGMVLLAGASFSAAAAPTGWALLVTRFVQGAGAALAAPPALALLGTVPADARSRARVRAAWGGLSGVGAGLGLLVAGLAGAWTSWRWAFLVLAVVGLVVAAGARRLPAGPPAQRVPMDPVGVVLVTVGLGLCSYGLVTAGDETWGSPGVVGPLTAGLALLVAFVVVERFPAQPLVPPSFLASRVRAVALVAATLPPAIGASSAFLLPLYFQDVLDWSVLAATFGLVPYTVGLAIGSLASGSLMGRVGAAWTISAGLAVTAAGLAVLGGMTADPSDAWLVLAGLLVFQTGAGAAAGAAVAAVTDGVGPEQASVAGGVANAAMLTGGALGLALLSSLASDRTAALDDLAAGAAAAEGYAWAFTVAAAASAVAAVVTAVGLRRRRR